MKKKVFLDFRNWKVTETRNDMANGFPLPTYEYKLGEDPDGKEWFVHVRFMRDEAKYEIGFDFSENGESPFLKEEVLYADDYVTARRLAYRVQKIRYDEFPDIVRNFMEEKGIN